MLNKWNYKKLNIDEQNEIIKKLNIITLKKINQM